MISAVILTHNDEATIRSCIESVLWCDEIVVIDDLSTDGTTAIVASLCSAHPKRIIQYHRALKRDFAAQRNFGLEKATGEWVLFLDADEQVSASLQQEIRAAVRRNKSEISGYSCMRLDYFFGMWLKHGDIGQQELVRLGRKQSGSWHGPVHETWTITGKIAPLSYPLEHFPHSTITAFLSDINFYTDIRSDELVRNNVTVSFAAIAIYPLGKFLKQYILQSGFRDGIPGLLLALMMSFHSFLVRAKTWNKQQHEHRH